MENNVPVLTNSEQPPETNIENQSNYITFNNAPKKKPIKKLFAILLAVCVVIISCLFIFNRSDEDKILDRLNDFATAYSEGDADGLIDCLDKRSKNQVEGMLGIGGSLLGIDIEDIFGFSVGATDDGMTIEVLNITFINENTAEVEVNLIYDQSFPYSSNKDHETFDMIKENNDWYIVEEVSLF